MFVAKYSDGYAVLGSPFPQPQLMLLFLDIKLLNATFLSYQRTSDSSVQSLPCAQSMLSKISRVTAFRLCVDHLVAIGPLSSRGVNLSWAHTLMTGSILIYINSGFLLLKLRHGPTSLCFALKTLAIHSSQREILIYRKNSKTLL